MILFELIYITNNIRYDDSLVFSWHTITDHLDKPLEEVWPALGMPPLPLSIALSNTTLATIMQVCFTLTRVTPLLMEVYSLTKVGKE